MQQYYKVLNFRFSVSRYRTSMAQIEKGNTAGFTISVILFSTAMILLIKAAEKERRGQRQDQDNPQAKHLWMR